MKGNRLHARIDHGTGFRFIALAVEPFDDMIAFIPIVIRSHQLPLPANQQDAVPSNNGE